MKQGRHAQAAFMQHISEQRSHRIALKTGRMRASALNPGRVSAVIKPVPESLASPQGPMAQFYKEPQMIRAAAKTHHHHHPSPAQPPPAPRLQSKGALTDDFNAASSRWGRPALACRRRLLPGAGRGREETFQLRKELWRNLGPHLWSNRLNQVRLTA